MRRKIHDGRAALSLLYQMDRWAFLIGISTSVIQSLVLPFVLLIVWKGISLVMAGAGRGRDLAHEGILLLAGFFGLLALQHLLRIASDTARSILQAECSQKVNARLMGKMSEVPYRLFEDNDFQARYGLLISQASHRPAMLVQAFISSANAFGSALAIAVTLLALAPLLDLFLLVLIPLTIVETRFHGRILRLQTASAPGLFRMTYLSQRSIDATWQRDIRVHNSTVIDEEYRMLSHQYLSNLKRLLRRYQVIRVGAGLVAAAIMTLAMGAVFWQISQSPAGPAEAAILLPALFVGLTQARSFSSSWGSLTECLGYIAQVVDFLNQSFEKAEGVPMGKTKPVSPLPATAAGVR